MEPAEREAHTAEGRRLKDGVAAREAELAAAELALRGAMTGIPNFVHPDVPEGGEDDSREIRRHGEPPRFAFQPLDHLQLAEKHDLVDFESGTRVAGAEVLLPEERSGAARAGAPAPRGRNAARRRLRAVHDARPREGRDRRSPRLQPARRRDPDLLGRRHRSLSGGHRGDHARRTLPRRAARRRASCRASSPASRTASAPKPVRTAARARASTACTSSPRWRCSR